VEPSQLQHYPLSQIDAIVVPRRIWLNLQSITRKGECAGAKYFDAYFDDLAYCGEMPAFDVKYPDKSIRPLKTLADRSVQFFDFNPRASAFCNAPALWSGAASAANSSN
jgi:hypothetical protein